MKQELLTFPKQVLKITSVFLVGLVLLNRSFSVQYFVSHCLTFSPISFIH